MIKLLIISVYINPSEVRFRTFKKCFKLNFMNKKKSAIKEIMEKKSGYTETPKDMVKYILLA